MSYRQSSSQKQILLGGCALFAMLFGAGNVVLPLIQGRAFGQMLPIVLMGFLLTAVILPLLGFSSVILARGDYSRFLEKLGRLPALLIGLICMTLLGPLGAIPRCIAIAHADLSWYLPSLSTWVFSGCAALLIWLCTYRETQVIHVLGRYLGPVKILCLLAIAVSGLLLPGMPLSPSDIDAQHGFLRGFLDGYGTMDLLAIIFFSKLIFSGLDQEERKLEPHELFKKALGISLVAGILLALVYIGFAGMAALHGSKIPNVADDMLLSALATTVLGTNAGLFVNITIAITCLVTSIALSSTFADYLSGDLLKGRISYQASLLLTIISAALMANLRFSGLMKIIIPIVSFIYPALMVFAALHIATILKGLNPNYARAGFFLTLGFMSLSLVV